MIGEMCWVVQYWDFEHCIAGAHGKDHGANRLDGI